MNRAAAFRCRYHAALSPAAPPPMMTTCAAFSLLLLKVSASDSADVADRRILMHKLHQAPHVLDWRLRQDAMPDIEDISRAPSHLFEDMLRARLKRLPRREQRHRIKVSLQGNIVAQAAARIRHLDAPVHADDGASRVAQLLQHAT